MSTSNWKDNNEQLTIGELLDCLKELDKRVSGDVLVKVGLINPQSYRGWHSQIAFDIKPVRSLADMISDLEWTVGRHFPGWKGGEFEMSRDTLCWLSMEGYASGVHLTKGLLCTLFGIVW